MNRNEIAALLRPFVELQPRQLDDISMYIDLLLKWNSRVNLTAVRKPEEMVQRHFGESFFVAARLLQPDDATSAIDLGSGAGFPGIPLAMFAPQARVTLIESNGKKAAFLNEAVRTLKLSNVTVFSRRAEDYSGQAQLVTMRAVEKFEKAAKVAVNLVEVGGRLALMIGAAQISAVEGISRNLAWQDGIPIPGGHSRVLLVGTKAVKVERKQQNTA
jgi:16S rRNA (guanine527-N7)-methyltransferase